LLDARAKKLFSVGACRVRSNISISLYGCAASAAAASSNTGAQAASERSPRGENALCRPAPPAFLLIIRRRSPPATKLGALKI